jgi:hypothetical protein
MGTIKRFGKVRLAVFGGEHGRAHFHLAGPGFQCSLDMETLEVLAGDAPAAVLRRVREWAKANREIIAAAWEEWNA